MPNTEQNIIVIDVREPDEYAAGHVDGAINIPLSSIEDNVAIIAQLPVDMKIIVYCRTGVRAATAAKQLAGLGFKNVLNGVNKAQVEAGLAH